jgi:predicted transcriptional regulator
MFIGSLCTKDVVCIVRGASLREAAQLMKSRHVGALVVTEKTGRKNPIGIITDRDIVIGAVALNLVPVCNVDDLMSMNVVRANRNDSILDVVRLMESEKVRRIVIVDDHDNVYGIVSADDILRLISQEVTALANLMVSQIDKESSSFDHREAISF